MLVGKARNMADAGKGDEKAKGVGMQEKSVQAKRDAAFYRFNPTKLEQLRSSKPWMKDPKYFKKVIVSAGAAIKMVRCLALTERTIFHMLCCL